MKKSWLSLPSFIGRILCLSLLCWGIFAPGSSQASENKFTIVVDGTPIPTAYINQAGRLMVPPVFFQRAGVFVDWNAENQAFELEEQNVRLSLSADNGHLIEDGKTSYVPLRYATEHLGMDVSFDASTFTVMINTNRTDSNQARKNEEIYWLYQITEAEAGGEVHAGKVAVAASVLNRVKSPDYPNTIKEVIFQVIRKNGADYYQFSPVKDKRIYSVIPSKDTIAAVNEAIKGTDPANGSVVFYNPKKTTNQWVRSRQVKATIGNHVFAAK